MAELVHLETYWKLMQCRRKRACFSSTALLGITFAAAAGGFSTPTVEPAELVSQSRVNGNWKKDTKGAYFGEEGGGYLKHNKTGRNDPVSERLGRSPQ